METKVILKSIDMDIYRAEVLETQKIKLEDADAEIDPFEVGGGGMKAVPELIV